MPVSLLDHRKLFPTIGQINDFIKSSIQRLNDYGHPFYDITNIRSNLLKIVKIIIAINHYLLESPESSSPIVTRAVAAGLQGIFYDNYQLRFWQRIFLPLLAAFPHALGMD